MITEVTIQNYKSIRSASLKLGKLTALVGPNASGKTSLLCALAPRLEPTPQLLWRHDRTLHIAIQWLEDGRTGSVSCSVGMGRQWHGKRYQYVRFDLDRMRQRNTVAEATLLDETGSNLANVFATLTRKTQEKVAQALRLLVPVLGDVDVKPVLNGVHELRFQDRWDPDLWFTPQEVSDGTILMLGFLVLQHQQPATELLAVEEPDRGLHPYLLGELIKLLRGMSDGTIGPAPMQIVLATHSAELLDHLRPEEVRFLTRDPKDGSVVVESVDPATPDWQGAFAEYKQSLGSVWLSGNLGGVP